MPDLLFEIFSEEIPARMQDNAASMLQSLLVDELSKNGLPHEDATYYVTPRRMTVHITGIPAEQKNFTEETKGPRVGSPNEAIQGFLRKSGFSELNQCIIKTIDGTDFYFAQKHVQGQKTLGMLGDILTSSIKRMTWPKSMRWANFDIRWARPFHNILAQFDTETIPGSIDFGGGFTLRFTNFTYGHRFLSNGEKIQSSGFVDYKNKLEQAGVILDQRYRRDKIWADVQELARSNGFTVKTDDKLLNEVTGLVEFPVPFMGEFPESFLEIPHEVISTSMREHQRYFSVLDKDGKIVNRFICVANIRPDDNGKVIIHGNEKVLRARLSDARFFWDQDLKSKLNDLTPRLSHIRFHEKLGTMLEKANRLKNLAGLIAGLIQADVAKSERAGYLAKADLVTGMVREFPELQGIMGGYYANHSGEDIVVARAIASHYSPVGPNDSCPTDLESVSVALADKIDTLVGFFSINEIPTGSKDPFALRRAALGIIRLIVEHKLNIDLAQVVSDAAGLYQKPSPQGLDEFIYGRLKVVLVDQGIPHKLVDSTLASPKEMNIYHMHLLAMTLAKAFKDHSNLFDQLKRVVNILASEKYDTPSYDRSAFMQVEEERTLFEKMEAIEKDFTNMIAAHNYEGAIEVFSTLTDPLAQFFSAVMILDKDEAIRHRRIFLLRAISERFSRISDLKLLF